MSRKTKLVFNAHQGSCPFTRHEKCNDNCAFFAKIGNAGKCRLLGEGAESADTGYFFEEEIRPYGNYH